MKKIVILLLLLLFSVSNVLFAMSDESIQEIQQLISDVKAGKKNVDILNEQMTMHCQPPLFLLTKQQFWIEKRLKNGKDKLFAQLIKDLLDAGADPNLPNFDTETILGNAIMHASVEVVQLLLDCGADPMLRHKTKNYGQAQSIKDQLLAMLNVYKDRSGEFEDKLVLLNEYISRKYIKI